MALAKSIRRPAPPPRAPGRNARPPNVEALEQRLAPDAAMAVGQLYRDLLQRTPDPSGLAHWSAALDSGLTRSQVALQITASPEYQGNQVQALYQRFLHREADPEGLRHHMNALAQGASVGQVAAVMAASAEYRTRFASGDPAFVQTLIADALGRTASDSEVSTLVGSKDRLQIAAAVLDSPEAHRQQVRDAYTRLLQRDADPSGLAHWSGALDRGLLTEEAVAALLAGSAESADLVRDGGLIAPLGGDGIVPQTTGYTVPLLFQGINPIRVVDTRFAGTASVYGSPALVGGATRDFDLIPNVSPNDLPAGVKALVLTVTLVDSPGGGAVNYVTIYPTGGAFPPTASLVTDHDGALTSSEVISAVSASGSISVFAFSATDLVIDITGYFLDDLRTGDRLAITGDYGSGGLVSASNASTTASVSGLQGTISSTSAGANSAGVRGINNGTGFNGFGVWGSQAGAGRGVYGSVTGAGVGVYGLAGTSGIGVRGVATGSFSKGIDGRGETGVYGSGAVYGGQFFADSGGTGVLGSGFDFGSRGVYGSGETGVSGQGGLYGVRGDGTSFGVWGTTSTGIGVLGEASGTDGQGGYFSGSGIGIRTFGGTYGVHSEAIAVGGWGVYGTNTASAAPGNRGVRGFLSSSAFGIAVEGEGGFTSGYFHNTGSGFGVYAETGAGGIGVFSTDGYGGTGSKYFIDPHPTDPTKEIRYVTLEGPENGVYYRGTGHFVDGLATISFPDYFTWETEAEGLTMQVTPVGALAMTAIQTLTTEGATLISSADVEFHYTVNGVRAGYADYNPIHENQVWKPRTINWATANEVQKQRLISTGLYHEDGTPNMETIRGLGWDTPEHMGVPSATPPAPPSV